MVCDVRGVLAYGDPNLGRRKAAMGSKRKKEAKISIISTSTGGLKTFTVPSAPAQVYFLFTEEMQEHEYLLFNWIYILPLVQELTVAYPRAPASNFSL